MPRPKKIEPRTEQLNIGLTKAEFESIETRARAVGMRPVHFGRYLLTRPEGKTAPGVPAENRGQGLIYVQLSRLGNNLNQMVRHLNTTGDPLPADLEPLLTDIRKILARAAG